MRILLAVAAAALLAGCGKKDETIDLMAREVTLPNGNRIICTPAQSEMEILQGLRYYESLPDDRGMLFIYGQQDKHPFWTYKAHFSVDIVWIDKDFRIVEMSQNAQPCNKAAHECPTFGGKQDSRYVLEVAAGVATRNGLRQGDKLQF
jgi:uncharacterized membrane protein (UPF0127 family)